MPNSSGKRGFTLIELLIVVVIIGILAAIAIPKFQETKGKAFASSLKSDLRNLSSVQEDYFYYNDAESMLPYIKAGRMYKMYRLLLLLVFIFNFMLNT